MFFEALINNTISFYKENKIALFHKKEIPIKFSKIENKDNKRIAKNAFIKNKSTTDYYGVYNGIFVAFEAKSTNQESLPMQNIKEHQIEYLKEVSKMKGKSFLFIWFNRYNEAIALTPRIIEKIKERKSISHEFAKKHGKTFYIEFPGIIDFVKAI